MQLSNTHIHGYSHQDMGLAKLHLVNSVVLAATAYQLAIELTWICNQWPSISTGAIIKNLQ